MQNLFIGTLIISAFLFSPFSLVAQDSNRTYRLEDGTSLSKAQVDSLSELYNDQIKWEYIREDGKTVAIVKLPENNQNKLSSSFTFTDSNTESKSNKEEVENMEVEYVYLDTLNREITKSAFQSLMKELGVHPHYSIKNYGDKKEITMSPGNSPEAKALAKELSRKRGSLLEMKGNPFPFEKMTDIEGNIYNPEFFEGKVVVLNYWFVECAPCIREMPHLNELVYEYSDNEEILFIAPSLSDKDKIEKMLGKRPFEYVLIPDADNHSNSIGIVGYPTHMVINQEGNVTLLETGYHDDTIDKLRLEIKRLIE